MSSNNLQNEISQRPLLPAGIKPYYERDGIAIVHGDCRDILPLLPAGSVDLVLTDPPYGVHVEENRRGFMGDRIGQDAHGWDKKPSNELITFVRLLAPLSIIWGYGYFADALGSCVAPLVWDKKTGKNFFADGELAFTSFTSGTLRIFRHQWCGCFKDSERGEKQVHPTQKPIALMRWCIEQADKHGRKVQTVSDPFMGVGTALVASKQLGRRAIGIEIEERYCEIAVKRLAQEIFAPI